MCLSSSRQWLVWADSFYSVGIFGKCLALIQQLFIRLAVAYASEINWSSVPSGTVGQLVSVIDGQLSILFSREDFPVQQWGPDLVYNRNTIAKLS